VPEISATEAARNFADLLDAVEHGGERFTIVRRGKVVAQIEPSRRGRGSEVKAMLAKHHPDHAWRRELDAMRGLLDVDPRS
jgi:prevent-host-death family protein